MGDVLYNEKVVPGEVLTMSYYKIKIGWRKVEMCGVGWGKWFLTQHYCTEYGGS